MYVKFRINKSIKDEIRRFSRDRGISMGRLLELLLTGFLHNDEIANECLSMMPYNLYKVYEESPVLHRTFISNDIFEESVSACKTLGIPLTRFCGTLCALFAKGDVEFKNISETREYRVTVRKKMKRKGILI